MIMHKTPPGVTLRGDRNCCPGCGELFNSTHAFELHRTGTHNRPRARRCLTPDEMRAKGMAQRGDKFWISEFRVSPLVTDWPAFE
jgi:hypothetical protein